MSGEIGKKRDEQCLTTKLENSLMGRSTYALNSSYTLMPFPRSCDGRHGPQDKRVSALRLEAQTRSGPRRNKTAHSVVASTFPRALIAVGRALASALGSVEELLHTEGVRRAVE